MVISAFHYDFILGVRRRWSSRGILTAILPSASSEKQQDTQENNNTKDSQNHFHLFSLDQSFLSFPIRSLASLTLSPVFMVVNRCVNLS
jgi:hypothetical protein